MTAISFENASDTPPSFFDEITASKTITQVLSTSCKHWANKGVDKVFYLHLPHIGAIDHDEEYAASYPETIITSAHDESLFAIVDIMKKIRQLDTPLEVKGFLDWLEMTPDQEARLAKSIFSKHINGLVVPLHSANGRSGCMLIGFHDIHKKITPKEIRDLDWTSNFAHRQLCRLKKAQLPNPRKLTEREREIIKWVAKGKSNSVIGEIIGISPHTVNGYIRSIYLKTGTSDRTGATLRCIGEGLTDL